MWINADKHQVVSRERYRQILRSKRVGEERKGMVFNTQSSMTVISGPKRKIDEKEEKCTENEYQSFKDIYARLL